MNPAAAGGQVGGRWLQLEPQLRAAGVDFKAVLTEQKFHAAELVAAATAAGCRHLVAVGGDGTAHEVVNGIFLQKNCLPEEVTFALLPIGTGNDWVKTHRIPKKFPAWLACFLAGETSMQDVGSLTYRLQGRAAQRFFLNVAGLSYDGYVVKKSAEQAARFSSPLFYLWSTVRWLFGFQVPGARIFFDEKNIEGNFYTINIGICRYSGGGMQLVPQAVPDDGLLALTFAKKISKLEVLLVSPLFYSGKIGWHPKVSQFQVATVTVEPLAGQTVYLEADGEYLGEAPVRVEVLPRKLKVMVPSLRPGRP